MYKSLQKSVSGEVWIGTVDVLKQGFQSAGIGLLWQGMQCMGVLLLG